MRRRLWSETNAKNLEGLSSPENFGIWIPFHELFRPAISKSASCRCCFATQANCTDCRAAMPSTIHMTDSIYGAVTLTRSGLIWNGSRVGSANGYNANSCICANFGPINFTLNYQLSCGGSPPSLSMTVTYHVCSAGNAIIDDSATAFGSRFDATSHQLLPFDCSLSGSGLTLTISAQGALGTCGGIDVTNAYPNGVTFTLTP